MSTTPSPPPNTPRVDGIAWQLNADGSFATSAIHYYAGSAPAPTGTLRLRPEQYSDFLGQAGVKLNPQVLAAYDAKTNATPAAGPADVARMIHDFFWTWNLPTVTAPVPAPQTGTAPAIT